MTDREKPSSLELFTGAGGLALGVAQAGFQHRAVIEFNKKACSSLRDNQHLIPLMREWEVHESDARLFSFEQHADKLDLLAAGAPCQPFSLGGKHRGDADARNLFPVVFRAIRETRPKVVLIENVKGLLRTNFREYLEYIELQLRTPLLSAREGEDWRIHRQRLLELQSDDTALEHCYDVDHVLLNAADFGVPQRRERVFIAAFRADLDVNWRADFAWRLRPTHDEDALLYAKWIDGSYWNDHNIPVFRIPEKIPVRLRAKLKSLEKRGPGSRARWRTVRDALRGKNALEGEQPLPEPALDQQILDVPNHFANPGARGYKGHTGSPWDEPAKTLKAGDHGVPGGENMLRLDDGTVRYFSVREAARLQGFPDEYVFSGPWSEGFRQLGNAVPVSLARVVAGAVARVLATRNCEVATL